MKRPGFNYRPHFKPASEQTEEDKRLQASAFCIAVGLPLVGDLAREPASVVSPRHINTDLQLKEAPCPKH